MGSERQSGNLKQIGYLVSLDRGAGRTAEDEERKPEQEARGKPKEVEIVRGCCQADG